VTFSKAVTGVDAEDFLVNGAPAFALGGGGSNYTFTFAQPPAGAVNISWAVNHDITDLATSPNPFNATGAGATWSYTLDLRTTLVQSNSAWMFIKGLAEASNPIDAWRQLAFDDSGWSNALAPFFYGDPYNSAENPGTLLSDMRGATAASICGRHSTSWAPAGSRTCSSTHNATTGSSRGSTASRCSGSTPRLGKFPITARPRNHQ